MSIIIFIIILGLLIFVHELGHFLAAKKAGMYVEEFAIGFKPAIWQKKKKETNYILGLIPIGGYVKIFGENPTEIESDQNLKKKGRAFSDKNRAWQGVVISMGVLFNIVFAWLLLSSALMMGAPVATENYTPENPDFQIVQLPPHQALWTGAQTTGEYIKLTTVGFVDLFSEMVKGQADMDQISGPIGIVGLVSEAAENGFVSLLIFTALISISLAVINFLPFPALDGGRFIFIIIESIIRRPIKPIIFNTLNYIGFSLLILLMIFVTYHDIVKLIFT